jgi:hypothetical protein
VAGEKPFVDRDVLDAYDALVAFDLDDPVNQKERVTMRQNPHDLSDAQFQTVSLCGTDHSATGIHVTSTREATS